jgi:hypothetical protein
LRFQGDYIYYELVFSEELQRLGWSALGELRKQGEKYVGEVKQRMVWNGRVCDLGGARARTFEPPRDAKVDWKKCTFDKPYVWQAFVWIPE